jgi:5'-methylthioadenosine phosphorylase
MGRIAIIGGTGVCDTKILEHVQEGRMDTFYGSIQFWEGTYKGKEIIFLPRHGHTHSIPPHLINYRANILGLKRLDVKAIVATTAVGSLNANDKPNDFVLPDQFLDFTKCRHTSFFDGGENGVVHVDMTDPYCPTLRQAIIAAGRELGGYDIHPTGTYVCTEGPRFETPAEIAMFAKLGGDLVGMTNVPEVCLAREAEICYSTISMVTNFAAGISAAPLTHAEVVDAMEHNSLRLRSLIMKAIEMYDMEEDCSCRHSLQAYGGFTV